MLKNINNFQYKRGQNPAEGHREPDIEASVQRGRQHSGQSGTRRHSQRFESDVGGHQQAAR